MAKTKSRARVLRRRVKTLRSILAPYDDWPRDQRAWWRRDRLDALLNTIETDALKDDQAKFAQTLLEFEEWFAIERAFIANYPTSAIRTPPAGWTRREPSPAAKILIAKRWRAVDRLEQQRERQARRREQKEITAGLARAQTGLESATRYFQDIESAPADKQGEMFTVLRPTIVEALGPGFEQYIPQRLEDNPGFLSQAITLGLSASDAAGRRREALEALNKKWTEGGDVLARDEKILESLGVWLQDVETGEQIEEALKTVENTYLASPAVRQRIGEVPPGPLSAEAHRALLAKVTA